MRRTGVLAITVGLFWSAGAMAQSGSQPLGDISQYPGSTNYPPAALRADAQGRTVALLGISPQGRVTDCSIEGSSGNSDLDAETCQIATQRMRFQPARDEKKRPVASTYRLPIRWVLPTPPVDTVPPAPTPPAGS
ncbi:TonB family protein [Sphingomonas jinjuensis]|uniref:TonB family protein n=1 Tax=Sphingomonas jinjuensis TaxID=535907 RepID=A0A840FD76_9SPHN|nr:energy transducer TonB [Sphingomonas jinjuensis]MBB4153517.1 TonB family protein [Sphingomonas jinjuensis]